ncbi:unnamed protein product [Rotaria magnacalcarata]|uniref:Coiled-coil domain-containing protein 40 n=6 Tax=Rotaria TaxID=231623 RepID=A0A816HFU8_9BILA|nr:unnamed protein product [Rotaria magnacalcarata]CAF1685519.1 unnamed protein product [Rotaria magnacalcarata]CAF1966472.1 unnamed protein product [Rotaria magnacalcarata]CAF2094321.1 unnamed protein product [Rotaria magnacalcarata]CAF2112988.1 unnamed protein product [Rotaria magnacalcarata]
MSQYDDDNDVVGDGPGLPGVSFTDNTTANITDYPMNYADPNSAIDGAQELQDALTEDEQSLVVLDPSHPLMVRYQEALKKHLLSREEKLAIQLREADNELKKIREKRESLGVTLYNMQQELARHQMLLEKEHDHFGEINQDRQRIDQDLKQMKDKHLKKKDEHDSQMRQTLETQKERDVLQRRLHYMNKAKNDIRGDLSTMRRATEKVDTEVTKLEADKRIQDLFVDRLVQQVDNLREQISMYEYQLKVQMEETKNIKHTLVEARLEAETLDLETKQLMQNWNSCLIGIRRRDEAQSTMSEAVRLQLQRIDTMNTEMESYKRSIVKEQELNEKLTLVLNRTKYEIQNLEKLLQINSEKSETCKQEISTYTKALEETQIMLNRVNNEKAEKQHELNILQREIERENQDRVKLEDEIYQQVQNQMTAEKAAEYSSKLRFKLKEATREIERNLSKVENDIARARLEKTYLITNIRQLDSQAKEYHEQIVEKNQTITRSEQEIKRRVLLIEQKQNQIDLMNKRLENLKEKAGGTELGPLELEVLNLQKSIAQVEKEIFDLEQTWLKGQNELVHLTTEKDVLEKETDSMKLKHTILMSRKLRTENTITNMETDCTHLKRQIELLRLDLERLNKLIYKEGTAKTTLERNNMLSENDFVRELKDAEKDAVHMEGQLADIRIERENLLANLVEAEKQIMFWERKIQLAKEMKSAVDSETGQGEIRAMKSEIHRMQVRYEQLLRQQEKLIRDMETSVSRRETILTRGEFQQKLPQNKAIMQSTVQKKITDLQRKIRETTQQAGELEQQLEEYKMDQQEHVARMTELGGQRDQSTNENSKLDDRITELSLQKNMMLITLTEKQLRAKYYEQIKEGKYIKVHQTPDGLSNARENQINRLRYFETILHGLSERCPQFRRQFVQIQDMLRKRLSDQIARPSSSQ